MENLKTPSRKTEKYVERPVWFQKNALYNSTHWESSNIIRSQDHQYEVAVAQDPSIWNKAKIFLTKNVFGWLYYYLAYRFGPKHFYQSYSGLDQGVYQLNNQTNLAILADWGTDTEESNQVTDQVAKFDPDLSLHLGDVYFVGNEQEVQDNFDPKFGAWQYGKIGSLAVPGNHEMYSNGFAYFDTLLPKYMSIKQNDGWKRQKASFFCVENEHWRIVGLDTGYMSVSIPIWEMIFSPKAQLNQMQLDWLANQVKIQDPNDKRGIILLSHHQCLSAFEKTIFPTSACQIKQLMGENAKTVAWFWGHEHRTAMYDKQTIPDGLEAYVRCIGNGGMPEQGLALPDKNKDLAKATKLQYYDQRFRKVINKVDVGFNGFITLCLDNDQAKVQYIDQDNTLLFEETFSKDDAGNVFQMSMKDYGKFTKFEG